MLTNIFSNSKTKTFTIPANQQVKGNVESSIAVVVCGRVDGNIITESDVLIKPGGSVHGKISALNVVVEGKAYGAIRCKEKLTATPGAHIEGKIEAAEINIEAGAVFIERKEEPHQNGATVSHINGDTALHVNGATQHTESVAKEPAPAAAKPVLTANEKLTGVEDFSAEQAPPSERWF